MRVDSHQHFWQWSKGWFTASEPILSRDYLPPDLEPLLRRQGFQKSIVVQTSPVTAETEFLLELAESFGFIGGVVGWLDLEAPGFPSQLERYSRKPHFVGVRPMLQSLPEDDWILRPQVIESLKLMAASGVAFDFLTYTRHLPFVLKALERVPNLHAVIDHLSKPEIATGRLQPWQDLMRDVAVHPNVYCKLSGMVTEADHQNWSLDQLRPFADHVLQLFGADRVMFGSDWPVCLLAASYEQVVTAARTLVTDALGADAEPAVFGGAAAEFYGIAPAVNA